MTANLKINHVKYSALVAKAEPLVIKTKQEYKRMLDQLWQLMSKGENNLTPEEDRLLDLLAKLLEDYENKTQPDPDVPPNRMVKHLMDARNLKQADLVPILGTRGRVSEILSGKREISKAQAKALGEFF